jgi:competence protein ComEC
MSLAPYPAKLARGRLEIAVLDVGQGDAIFISFPKGATMLVDGGGAIPIPGAPPPRLNVGESVISSYLWSRNVQQLDYVVLTHDHYDHFGGLEPVLRNFRVGELWMGPDPADRPMDRLRAVAASRSTRSIHVEQGHGSMIDGVKVEVLSPPAGWTPSRVSNNDSVVLRLTYGGRTILLPGDVEARMEQRLAQDGVELASDVLKIAHHGSRTSTTAEFLSRVSPTFGVISVGAFKRFGHPNDDVLAALAAAGVQTYRTDQDGTVTFSTDGHRLDVATHRDMLRPWPRFVDGEP